MKQTRLLMGMPITVEVVDDFATSQTLDEIYAYLTYIDETFSTYKASSEISRINRGELLLEQASDDMQTIFALAEQTRQETDGYFDIEHNGQIDPSGIVKGWAIYKAAEILWQRGFENFYVDAGGDIQVSGKNSQGDLWRVGIQHPFEPNKIVKALSLSDCGIATSGTYVRGQHIYNPQNRGQIIDEIVSLTVVGANVYEADRFATAAFAMGKMGIAFIEELEGFEGYMISSDGLAAFTSGFTKVVSYD